jgi:phosphopantothenoylcysteine synthetase/decarboxylase
MPTLSIVVCGAPLASRTADLRAQAEGQGWDVVVTVTDAAREWWTSTTEGSAHEARHPDAVLVCPLTFNTASKWALGISDNRALGLLNEALGSRIPVVAVPMVNDSLWRHPAWASTLQRLQNASVQLVDPATGAREPRPVRSGTGEQVSETFEPTWVLNLLTADP